MNAVDPIAHEATANRNAVPLIDSVTQDALTSFKAILVAKYGMHLRSLYLFGSRARGDYRQDSDVDVAVFLDEAPDPIGEQFDLIERGYDIVLSSGLNIQPWVFTQASLSDPAQQRTSHLVNTIRREGIPL